MSRRGHKKIDSYAFYESESNTSLFKISRFFEAVEQ